MHYTPLASYSIPELPVLQAPVRAPMMSAMTSISPVTGELMVPGNAGVIIQADSGKQAIRVGGTAMSSNMTLVGANSTLNQIQFFSNGQLVSAFDQRGLYFSDDNKSIYTGSLSVNKNIWLPTTGSPSLYFTDNWNGGNPTSIQSYLRMFAVAGTSFIDFAGDFVYRLYAGNGTTSVNGSLMRLNNTGLNVTAPINGATILSNAANGNLAVGANAFVYTGAGSLGTTIGANAGNASMMGNANTCVGAYTGNAITNGYQNSLLGSSAGNSLTGGLANTYIGFSAGRTVTTGESNVGIGMYSAGSFSGSTGNCNSCVGGFSGERLTTGANNVIVGFAAGQFLTTGDRNTLIGRMAGYNMSTGLVNVCIGESAGSQITTGQNNIIIGQGSNASSGNTSNETVIGSNLGGNGPGTTTISGNSVFFTLVGQANKPIMAMNNDAVYIYGTGAASTDGRALSLLRGDNDANSRWLIYAAPNGNLIFKNNAYGGQYISMTPNGGTPTVSDIRSKHNIKPLTNGLSIVTRMNPVYYNYISDNTNKLQSGLIAQELLPLIPEAVDTADPERFGINYVMITPYLIKSIQEQQIEITSLKTLVSDLQVQLSLLKSVVDTLVSK
jgi:hypothetical protein